MIYQAKLFQTYCLIATCHIDFNMIPNYAYHFIVPILYLYIHYYIIHNSNSILQNEQHIPFKNLLQLLITMPKWLSLLCIRISLNWQPPILLFFILLF